MSQVAPAAERLLKLLQHLPAAQHAVAYGSGVFHQPDLYSSGEDAAPMIDFLLAVDDPVIWHDENIKRNPSHYSFMRWLGPAAVAGLASKVGAGVYFNTLVPMAGQVVKYGVLSRQEMVDDLLTWRHVYAAGRLHKPVATLVEQQQVQQANQRNLEAALATALLLSKQHFTTEELLQRICGLSYTGDVRMGVAEDRSKVARIVAGSRRGLEQMYLPLLAKGQSAQVANVQQLEPELWLQDTSADSRAQLLAALPAALLQQLASSSSVRQHSIQAIDADSRLRLHLAQAVLQFGQQSRTLIQQSLGRLVGMSSTRQAIAGLLMAGPVRATKYLAAKGAKAWKSRTS